MREYKIADTQEERDAALALIASTPWLCAATLPSLAMRAMENVSKLHSENKMVWMIAKEGDLVVASLGGVIHQMNDAHITLLCMGWMPGRETLPIFLNLRVILTQQLNWPGCCGNRWTAIQPPYEWITGGSDGTPLSYICDDITVTDAPIDGLVQVSGTYQGWRELLPDDY